MNKAPTLRFKGSESDYEMKKISSLLDRVSNSVDINPIEFYRQIGIRSHGKGIFHKEAVNGESLGNKRVFWVEPNVFILNIVFAWERAIAKTTDAEIGMIASHRFPMYRPKSEVLDLDYITLFFKTNRGKYLLELASPGGAGRNKTLGQKEFENLELAIPVISEQKKIASFFSLIDKKIELQTEKVEELKNYKKGIMQKIFSQELRFKDENGNEYPAWEGKKLGDIAECLDYRRKPLNSSERELIKGDIPYYGANGVVDYVNDYIFNEDIILLAEDGGNFDEFANRPIAQLIKGKSWVNNHAHVLKAKIDNDFLFYSLVHKDIRKYINGTSRSKLNKSDMLDILINVPNSTDEQRKISKLLGSIYIKISKEQEKLEYLNQYKKGLLQQMFI